MLPSLKAGTHILVFLQHSSPHTSKPGGQTLTLHSGIEPPPSVRYSVPALGSFVPGGQFLFGLGQLFLGTPGGHGGVSAHLRSLGYLMAGSHALWPNVLLQQSPNMVFRIGPNGVDVT